MPETFTIDSRAELDHFKDKNLSKSRQGLIEDKARQSLRT
jgi:hypothetical protein